MNKTDITVLVACAAMVVLLVLFANGDLHAYGYVEKNQSVTLYSDQYTICSLDPTHHNSVECYLIDKGKNLRDYLEALGNIQ